MAMNYGAILAFLLPVLLIWGQGKTGLIPTHYGLISLIMGFAALAVAVFGCRDWFAAKRLANLKTRPAASLIGSKLTRQHILVTGGTGFVGRRLVAVLTAAGHHVTVLTRKVESALHLEAPVQLITDLDHIQADTQITAIVNLAGHPIASGLWTAKHRRKVLRSRLKMSRNLRALCTRLDTKPQVFLSASAIGVYGVTQNTAVDETTLL